jgi:hypothetical protein
MNKVVRDFRIFVHIHCIMSNIELKREIDKVLDGMPEDALESVLNYLKSIAEMDSEDLKYARNLRRILDEDNELLQKLAQ